MPGYELRQCTDATCRFRFPMAAGERLGSRCPSCGGITAIVTTLAAPDEPEPLSNPPPRRAMSALVDNVRSAFNVGAIFRSADGAGLQHLYLCGVTPTPEHDKVAKTALGAQKSVGWSHHNNAVDLAIRLRSQGQTLWALEETTGALTITQAPPLPESLLLVVGSEVTGVDPDLLALCEHALCIPMRGAKRSLNVAIAFGIAVVVLGM